MSNTNEFETRPEPREPQSERCLGTSLGLVIVWAPGDPSHQGAWIPLDAGARRVLGRGAKLEGSGEATRAVALRQRPSGTVALPPMGNPSLSRVQLAIEEREGRLWVENLGRLPLRIDGAALARGEVRLGGVIELGAALVLQCVRRPLQLAPAVDAFAIGAADQFGIVGESPAAWQLRSAIERCGAQTGHVLVLGQTGVGKELVARALHRIADPPGAWVARNAATIPATLVDAELFGNAKGYPTHGLPERPGLVGAADRGTLFFDEFADLPEEAQAHLLRVLDAGEYHRLGESRARQSRFRLLAATSRPPSALRTDLAARFDFVVQVPSLAERLEDVPFLAAHLLRGMIEDKPQLAARAFEQAGHARLSSALVARLLRQQFTGNVRELRQLLWRSLLQCGGGPLRWPSEPTAAAVGVVVPHLAATPAQPRPETTGTSSPPHAPGPEGVAGVGGAPGAVGASGAHERTPASASPAAEPLGPAVIQAALDANNGSLAVTYRVLGLSSRHVLARLIKKHRLRVTRTAGR